MPVVAVASRTAERREKVAARVGGRAVRYDELPAGADIVIVATPPGQHADDTRRALGAGASVLLEKPLCPTLAEADALAAHPDADRVLYAENLAYAPVVERFVLGARGIGELTHLEVRTVSPLPTWGPFTTDEWGGGALFDLGVHPIAIAVLAAAPRRPVSVQATLRGAADGSHGSDEHGEMTIEFDDGLRASVVASWQGGPTPIWDAQAAGPTGVVRIELLPAPVLEVNGSPSPLPQPRTKPPAVEQFGYLGQLEALAADVAAGRRPFMDVSFGRMILDLVCAAYTSARTGSPEPVPFTGPRDRTPLQLWRGR
jgi:predicted dehydrogenase